jgi:uncharacterized SAM-binding protein YcdF (DUF218 family)
MQKHPRLRRLLRILLVVFGIVLVLDMILAATLYLYGGVNRAQPADVIIVLGAGLRNNGRPDMALTRRSMRAAELWQQGMASHIICTGGVSERVARPEAEGCRDVLLEQGVPDEAILLESRSRSTEENALNSHMMMQENGWETAVLVTDGFHMMRATWIFRDEGITVYGSPVSSSRVYFGPLLVYVAREVVALQWQFVKNALGISNTYVQGI